MKPRRLLAALLAWAAACSAHAGCTRDINVPVSASGASVITDDGGVKGIYPDLLRSLGQKNGCRFIYTVVPRARQVAMFSHGRADLLVPASRTPGRDQAGTFVPMISHRPMLISVRGNKPPLASVQDLLDHKQLRVAVVRGFDYGERYNQLVNELGRQGRLFVEVDVVDVARLLSAGAADVTIMGPTLMEGAIRRDARVQGLEEKLHFEALPEFPWNQSGVYISNALKPDDRNTLREMLERAGKSNQVMEGYLHYFRPELLKDSVRPL